MTQQKPKKNSPNPTAFIVIGITALAALKLIHGLLGNRASYKLKAVWNWLWGLSPEPDSKMAVQVAQESLHSMQQSVLKLTESVAKISASYQQAKQKYDSKKQEFMQLEQQASLANYHGNEAAARLAMGKAIALDKLLPTLAGQVARSEQILMVNKDKLNRERQRLETYKMELQNLKDLSEVNEALADIAKVNGSVSTDSAQSQFEEAQLSIHKRYLQTNALVELSENPAEKLTADLDNMMLDDEISRRLLELNLYNQSHVLPVEENRN
ncbi:PspA/IM30 family protein [Microcoleus vaginatus]|uniref:PspA/IM30 family protein n=1 Tax=Microcoleus vaginatus TaxID=119532 RepID=UPI001F60C898|nr:PspA/IM30 family protein [Microcoleus vaginatus HSN003]